MHVFMLRLAEFNFVDWMKFKELEFGSFSNHGTQFLMQELGIDSLLYHPMCNIQDKKYGPDQSNEGKIRENSSEICSL